MEIGEFPELFYQGRCRYKKLPYDKDTGLRVQFDSAPETFQDLVIGHQEQSPSSQCGDLLLKDKKKNWSYHFANVVDDISEGVNLIIRGQDLLSSTGRQIKLIKMLHASTIPMYAHHPLVMENDQIQKLSKRNRSESISEMIEQGRSAETILGMAAYAVGLLDQEYPIENREIETLFDWFSVKEWVRLRYKVSILP